MENDIKKLSQVISSLEENSTQVSEFNGILTSVNEARLAIESSKEILKKVSDDHQQSNTSINNKYDDFLKNLGVVEQRIIDLEAKQDECLQKISDLNILTPQRFEKGRKASNAAIDQRISDLESKIDTINHAHRSAIKKLAFVTAFGALVLLAGVIFISMNWTTAP
jgi:chromosome segregation ATPase